MVSIPVILALVSIFLAVGGIGVTKSALGNAKGLVTDIQKQLGKNDSDTSQQSPEDRNEDDQ